MAERADSFGSIFSQLGDPGFPLMLSATSMFTAWALQPDEAPTSWGQVLWQDAQVAGWMLQVM
jgi:hypothetical protein